MPNLRAYSLAHYSLCSRGRNYCFAIIALLFPNWRNAPSNPYWLWPPIYCTWPPFVFTSASDFDIYFGLGSQTPMHKSCLDTHLLICALLQTSHRPGDPKRMAQDLQAKLSELQVGLLCRLLAVFAPSSFDSTSRGIPNQAQHLACVLLSPYCNQYVGKLPAFNYANCSKLPFN